MTACVVVVGTCRPAYCIAHRRSKSAPSAAGAQELARSSRRRSRRPCRRRRAGRRRCCRWFLHVRRYWPGYRYRVRRHRHRYRHRWRRRYRLCLKSVTVVHAGSSLPLEQSSQVSASTSRQTLGFSGSLNPQSIVDAVVVVVRVAQIAQPVGVEVGAVRSPDCRRSHTKQSSQAVVASTSRSDIEDSTESVHAHRRRRRCRRPGSPVVARTRRCRSRNRR